MRIAALELPTFLGKNSKYAQNEFIKGYSSLDADIFIGPEYLWGSTVSSKELTDIIGKFNSEKIAIPGTIFNTQKGGVYNTAFIISNGKVLHSYNKETISQESQFIDGYMTGNNYSSVFDILGKKFGIEICRDHGMSRLKRKTDSVDIHLVLANNIYLSPSKLIGKEYSLLVDGKMGDSDSVLLNDTLDLVEGKKINNFKIYDV